MFRFVVSSTLAIFALASSNPQDLQWNPLFFEGRIVGGEPVEIENYPYQVSLLYGGRHTCGGSIISEQYVITAAHCTYRTDVTNYSIRVGSSNVTSGGVVVNIKKINIHPQFFGLDYDITILELEKCLNFSKSINKIELPKLNEQILVNTSSVVSGWGVLEEGGSMPDQLQAVKVLISDQEYCKKVYKPLANVTERMICAGVPEGGKDACQGDSGGPLVINGKLVGVVSWGAGCGSPVYPGVYSNVPNLRDFVKDITGL